MLSATIAISLETESGPKCMFTVIGLHVSAIRTSNQEKDVGVEQRMLATGWL
jgi:uncharacterized ferredoxin-like protein